MEKSGAEILNNFISEFTKWPQTKDKASQFSQNTVAWEFCI